MPMSMYPNGFTDGVSIRGVPINIGFPGKVVYVNNSSVIPAGGIAGSDTNQGTYLAPFYTLAAAVAVCVADRGDIIYVMPGHAETVSSATALTINKAGISVIGLGQGTKRPLFTLTTANTATINATANNIAFINCRFVANFLAIAACFTLTTAANFTLQNCAFADTSAILNFAKIVNVSSTDNAADGLRIEGCEIISSHATNAFSVLGAVANIDRAVIQYNNIRSVTTNAAAVIAPITNGKVMTNALINNNNINTVGATGTATGLLFTTNQTTNSGIVENNYLQNLATAPILATAASGFRYFQNFVQDANDASGILIPAGA